MPLRALLLKNGDVDVDAELELVLLQLWVSIDPDQLSAELLALDDKCWRRLGLLLFSTESSLVLALVATLERAATRPPNTKTSDRLLRRMWWTQWRDHLREKVLDCHARLAREGIRSGRTEDDLVVSRLLQIVGISLRVTLTPSHDAQLEDQINGETRDNSDEAPKVMEVVDLLLSLSTTTERTPSVARVAAVELQSLFSLAPHAFSGIMTTHICRSTSMRHYVAWLVGDGGCGSSTPVPDPLKQLTPLEWNSTTSKTLGAHGCDHVYIELLVAAAAVARPDASKRRGVKSPVFDDTAAMLQICTLGVGSSDSTIQYAALHLLSSLLVLDDAASIALSSAVRLSGILISISWLLNHTVSHIAAMAATTLELIIRHSPPSDILRAVIEQGCVMIYRALLSSATNGAKKNPAQAAVAASCRSLLNWVTEEVAWQSGVVAASVQSILRSTNILLQKNIALTLQILAQRNAAIREALEDQDFLAEALVAAVQADDDAGLAVSLLSICLNCSDKCSTLKIEVFHHDNNDEQSEEQPTSHSDENERTIRLRCANNEFVDARVAPLREHSNLARGLKLESQDQQEKGSAVVNGLREFRASTVQTFVDLLPKAQQEAVSGLIELQSFPLLHELLRVANASGSAKCWHVTTSTICRMMTASNWLDILQFASADVRHPTLVLRCIRFALQLHSALGPRENTGQPLESSEKQSQVDPIDQERAELASALKTAAIQLSHELFVG